MGLTATAFETFNINAATIEVLLKPAETENPHDQN